MKHIVNNPTVMNTWKFVRNIVGILSVVMLIISPSPFKNIDFSNIESIEIKNKINKISYLVDGEDGHTKVIGYRHQSEK